MLEWNAPVGRSVGRLRYTPLTYLRHSQIAPAIAGARDRWEWTRLFDLHIIVNRIEKRALKKKKQKDLKKKTRNRDFYYIKER